MTLITILNSLIKFKCMAALNLIVLKKDFFILFYFIDQRNYVVEFIWKTCFILISIQIIYIISTRK